MKNIPEESNIQPSDDDNNLFQEQPPSQNSNTLINSAANEIYDWVETFIIALCIVIVLFTFVLRVVTVDGSSMEPTLFDKERLLISELFYTPKTGDIIVLQTPGYQNPLVKRVIATENQVIDIDFDTWQVSVDGVLLEENYINFISGTYMRNSGFQEYPYTVTKGHVFVMGDNRNHSTDSRSFGEVDSRNIVGRVILRVFPLKRAGIIPF